MTKVSIDVNVPIAASAEAVFDYISDTSKYPLWNSGLIEIDPKGRLNAGSSYRTISSLMGRTIEADNQVTAFEPNRSMTIVNAVRPLTYIATITVDPTPEGSTLSCHLDIKGASSIIHLAKPVLEYLGQSRLENDYRVLKVLVEAQRVDEKSESLSI